MAGLSCNGTIVSGAGATNLVLVTFLIPVSAIFLGSLVLSERLGWVHALGMTLIGLGLATIDGRFFKRSRSGKTPPSEYDNATDPALHHGWSMRESGLIG